MKLVLDEHVAAAVAAALARRGGEATPLAQWMSGAGLGRADDALQAHRRATFRRIAAMGRPTVTPAESASMGGHAG